jgi:poly(3-hydroxybutyrate) depolymerase
VASEYSVRRNCPSIRASTLLNRGSVFYRATAPLLLFFLILVTPVFAQTSFTPPTISFLNQALGVVSIPKAATFKNTQTVAVTISSIAIAGGNAPTDYAWGGNCPISPATLSAGKSCSIPVIFTPSAIGSRTATLTITDSASNSPQSITLSGNGVVPVNMSPTLLTFGNQAEGAASTAKTVTLKNAQTIPLTITSIGIAGGIAPADYSSSSNCPITPATLDAGLTCSVFVTFTPSALGSRTSSLTFADSAVNSPQSVALSGNGITPVSVSPTSITFANRMLGTTSNPMLVTVVNHLSTTLLFSSIATGGDFAVASNTCGSNLGAGSSCTVGVTFAPTAVGLIQGTLTINDNAFGSPSVIALGGTGNDTGLTSISVTPANPSLISGSTQQFVATGHFQNGSTQNLTPSVVWSSSQPNVAPMSASGVATGATAGTSLITATLSGVAGSTTLTVTPPVLVSIAVTPVNASIATGTTQQFTAIGTYSDGTTQDLTGTSTWLSSVPAVATILAGGSATAVASGTSSITVTSNGITGSTTLTIIPPALLSIAVTPSNASVAAGTAQQFTATGTYSDGSTQNVTSSVTWSSSAPGIATISNIAGSQGLVAATSVGATTITATSNAINGSATLTITAGFVLTGNLNTSRLAHTATLLNNGMVLLAAGSDSSGNPLASAELYNPATGLFTPTGNLNAARIGPTATLLNNGVVLIVGGVDSTGHSLASAELYDPTAAIFTPTGNLITARSSQTATLLNNGTVLIAGGYDSNGNALTAAEIYDPVAGTFSPVGDLTTARVGHTATLLNNGMVLIVGGADGSGNSLPSSELYDPVAATFTVTGSLNVARDQHTATLMNSGTVLIAGGINSSGILTSAELYDPTVGTFTVTGTLNTARDLHSATLLNNGTVLVSGGSGSSGALASAELYDPISATFTATGSLTTARAQHTATLLTSGAMLVAGGANSSGTVAAGELYEPATLTPPNLVAISLTPSNTAVGLGTAQAFIAAGTFSDGSAKQLASVTWSSSNSAVLSVTDDTSDPGVAYSLSAGTATVNACAGSLCGTATLTAGLPSLVSIAVTPPSATVPAGSSVQFYATGTFSDGSTQDLTSSVTWSSSVLSVATIPMAGLATGLTAGTTNISAAAANVIGSATLTVTTPVLASIVVTPGTASIAAGYTQQFAATGIFSDGSAQDLTLSAAWSSSAPTVAPISAGGLAAALTVGATSIEANVNGIIGTALFTVTAPALLSIAVTPTAASVAAGDTQQFAVTGTYSDGSIQNLSNTATWSSSVPSVATISSTGLATATTIGNSTVSASIGSSISTTSLTVTSPVLVSIALTPPNASISVGGTRQFTATGTYSDGSTQNLTGIATWSSLASTVATLSSTSGSQGLATGAGVGATTIQASSGSFSGSATVSVTPALTRGALTLITTTWAGLQRMYYIYIPKIVAPTPSMIVFLHATSTLSTVPLSSPGPWETIAEQYGALVVWPISTWDSTIMTWHWDCDGCESGFTVPPDDSGFVRSVIVALQTQYGIGPGQTFVAGMSSGGYMTQRVGMEQSDVIAAIAPVSGAQYIQPLGTNFIVPVVPNPVSVYRLNGDIDPVVPYCGGIKGYWAGVKAYSPSVDSDVDFWADQNVNSCTSTSQSQPLCTNGGPTDGVNGQDATGCKGGTEVIFEREIGVGHQWVTGTEAKIWAFFQTHGR